MKKLLQSYYYSLKSYFGIKSQTSTMANQKRIVIYIHHIEPFDASWVIITEYNEIQQIVLHGDLTTLKSIAPHYEIHVIIPGQDVLLTYAELPKLSRERLLQALPYAIEDKLVDDISKLHFAVGQFSPLGTPVAIISKEKINTLLHHLKLFDIAPHTMIPSTLVLPWTEHHWHASCDDTTCAIRTSPFSGFACDKPNFPTLLQLKILETPQKPEWLYLENITQTPMNLNLDHLLINETQITENQFLEKIALLFNTHSYINLLQGYYRPKRKSIQTKKIWVATAVLSGIWFFSSLFNNLISFFILNHTKNTLEQDIKLIYYEQFPSATSVVAPRERMETALKKASATTGQNDFLMLLSFVSDSLYQSKNVKVLNLNFQQNHLYLAVSAKSFADLDLLSHELSQSGLRVKQQNAAMAGTEVKADILISKGDL
jgi:general secretion pathway protein L